jgi:hypothetical protein
MLASLDVEQRPGAFAFVVGGSAALVAQAHAIVEEAEGRTLVVPTSAALDAGAAVEASWAWLTLTVHSSLEAVGLTAAFSAALAEVDTPAA